MKKIRNDIHEVLKQYFSSVGYMNQTTSKLPRAVFFMISNNNITSSNSKYVSKLRFQVSIYSTNIEDEKTKNIEYDFIKNGYFIFDNWNILDVSNEVDTIFHHRMEIEVLCHE